MLYLLSSIWAYGPVIGTIIFWMGVWSGSILFTSGYIFQYFYFGNVGWFNIWINLLNVGFTPGIRALLIIEVLIFVLGLVLFLWGVIQIAISLVEKEGLVTTGLYKYIRHPQLLGLIIMGFAWTLYIPGTYARRIKMGEIISWSLFAFILFLWSDFEEKQLAKKFGEEFVEYRSITGSFLPRIFNRTKKRRNYYEIKFWRRYLFTFLGYVSFLWLMYLVVYLLIQTDILVWY
ncbi:MAG: methyltransferase family protein [Candidatus Heimdallarchaeaceae archaeon]